MVSGFNFDSNLINLNDFMGLSRYSHPHLSGHFMWRAPKIIATYHNVRAIILRRGVNTKDPIFFFVFIDMLVYSDFWHLNSRHCRLLAIFNVHVRVLRVVIDYLSGRLKKSHVMQVIVCQHRRTAGQDQAVTGHCCLNKISFSLDEIDF